MPLHGRRVIGLTEMVRSVLLRSRGGPSQAVAALGGRSVPQWVPLQEARIDAAVWQTSLIQKAWIVAVVAF
jgi:hypothetical protein